MNMTLDDRHPVLDMAITLPMKVKDLLKLNAVLSRTYDEEESLRETLGPILQEVRMVIHEIESDPEWAMLHQWDCDQALLEKSAEKQKKHLKRIKKALLKDRHLRVSYCVSGTGEISKRTLIPLDLWEGGNLWLLRAYCFLEGEEHTFRVERMLKVKDKAPGKKNVYPGTARMAETASMVPEEEAEPVFPPSDDEEPAVEAFEDDAETAPAPDEPDGAPETVPQTGTDDTVTAEDSGPEGKRPAEATGPEPSVSHGHYSLPGKNPHQAGLPNRLDRLFKRGEHKHQHQ